MSESYKDPRRNPAILLHSATLRMLEAHMSSNERNQILQVAWGERPTLVAGGVTYNDTIGKLAIAVSCDPCGPKREVARAQDDILYDVHLISSQRQALRFAVCAGRISVASFTGRLTPEKLVRPLVMPENTRFMRTLSNACFSPEGTLAVREVLGEWDVIEPDVMVGDPRGQTTGIYDYVGAALEGEWRHRE